MSEQARAVDPAPTNDAEEVVPAPTNFTEKVVPAETDDADTSAGKDEPSVKSERVPASDDEDDPATTKAAAKATTGVITDELLNNLRSVAEHQAICRTKDTVSRRVSEARMVLSLCPDAEVWHSQSWAFHFTDPCDGCGTACPADAHRETARNAIKVCHKLPCSRGLKTHSKGATYGV